MDYIEAIEHLVELLRLKLMDPEYTTEDRKRIRWDFNTAVTAIAAKGDSDVVRTFTTARTAEMHVATAPAGKTLTDIERAVIGETLKTYRNNRTKTARALGISVRTLQRKLQLWFSEGEQDGR